MKESVKLLICILIGALIFSVIGMVTSHIIAYDFFNEELPNLLNDQIEKELTEKTEQMKEDFLNGKNNGEGLVSEDYLNSYSLTMMLSAVFGVYNTYYFFLSVGVIAGILGYLIFVKKSSAKKIVLPSTIGLVLILVVGSIFWYWDILDSSYDREEFIMIVSIYAICVIFAYVVNMLIQKHKVKKLNAVLKSSH